MLSGPAAISDLLERLAGSRAPLLHPFDAGCLPLNNVPGRPCIIWGVQVHTAILTGRGIPLRYRLFTPELQWQPRGKSCLAGRGGCA
jgi:hypothetical protein